MNRVELVGGLTRDPDCSVLQSGAASWFATIAVNGTRYDSQERQQVVRTTYVALSAYGWLAEQLINEGYGKGDELHVVGELDQYEVEKDGVKDRKTRVRPLVVNVTRRRLPLPTPTTTQQRPASGRDPWSQEPPEEPPF